MMAAHQTDPARQALGDTLAVATQIGWTDLALQISELLESGAAGNEET